MYLKSHEQYKQPTHKGFVNNRCNNNCLLNLHYCNAQIIAMFTRLKTKQIEIKLFVFLSRLC